MKTETTSSPEFPEFESTAERLADSLLSEHARLGSGNDDDLIANIFARTISNPTVTPAPPVFGMRNWLLMGTSVAALVTLLLLVLSNMQLKDNARSSDTFQFVVKMTGPLPTVNTASDTPTHKEGAPPVFAEPKAYQGQLNPVSEKPSIVSSVKIKDRNFQLVPQFDPSLNELPKHRTVVQSITISADESVHKGTEMRYSGKVVVTHKQFTLTADSLEVQLDRETGILIARGNSKLTMNTGEIKKLNSENEELILDGDSFRIRPVKYEIYAQPLLR